MGEENIDDVDPRPSLPYTRATMADVVTHAEPEMRCSHDREHAVLRG
jgi:hypothetical protein